MAESEMVRNPESWMLDFQPALKWDYCHGLELGAMLDVYDRYGDAKFFDYALAYADTMVNAAGDYVVSFIVSRYVDGKDWLQKKLHGKTEA